VEKFVGDELQVEIDMNESLKDAYTRCMKALLRMLLIASKVNIFKAAICIGNNTVHKCAI